MNPIQPIARAMEPSDFAVTHCMRCRAGWTRTIQTGAKAVFCLLDLAPVPANMTSCDRYDLREE